MNRCWRSPLGVLTLGLIVRLFVISLVFGNVDIIQFRGWIDVVHRLGIFGAFTSSIAKNTGGAAWLIFAMLDAASSFLGVRSDVVLRLAMSIADLLNCILIIKTVGECHGHPKETNLLVAATFLNPAVVMMTCTNGILSSLWILLVLQPIRSFQRGRIALSGLFLGSAIDLKPLLVSLTPLFFASSVGNQRAWAFGSVFLLSLAPWWVSLLLGGADQPQTHASYRAPLDYWGVSGLLLMAFGDARLSPSSLVPRSIIAFYEAAPYLLGLWIGYIIILVRRFGLDLPKAVALAIFGLIILTPGFSTHFIGIAAMFSVFLSWRAAWIIWVFGGIVAVGSFVRAATWSVQGWYAHYLLVRGALVPIGFVVWFSMCWTAVETVRRVRCQHLPGNQ